MNTALERAVSIAGSQSQLAERINVTQSTVWGWLKRNSKPTPPAEYCRKISEATNGEVSVHELRPDVFGPPPAKRKKPAQ